jgi:hypothetical protein
MAAVNAEIDAIKSQLAQVEAKMDGYLRELGLE